MTELTAIPLTRIDGSTTTLADYRGKVLLVVNTASKCGLTPQYEGLQSLYAAHRDEGLVVLGFPANNYAGQEPGTNEEIQEFCSTNYNVEFPLFARLSTRGEDQHPLYRELTSAIPKATPNPEGKLRATLEKHGIGPKTETEVMWNFEKFLIDRSGNVVGRFEPDLTPDSTAVQEAVQAELAKPAPGG
ncbi:MAG: glutathione peroxidase [Dehalococcoidia bacterium]